MFSRVRGASPFYLSVPQLNSILFVTEDRAGRATFHLFNVTAGTDVEIVGGNSDFGGHIGAPRPPGDDLTDYIESADTTAVVLATRNANRKIITVLDLTSRTVAKVEDVVLDSNGRDVQDRKRSASEQNL
jgi:hypothetical protein